MIQEDYCSYEVAKLLKEKGFDIPCHYTYHGGIKSEPFYHHKVKNFNGEEYSGKTTEWVSCPTHQTALKWLRETFNIHVVPKRDFYGGFYTGRIYDGRRELTADKEDYIACAGYDTYEEAADVAIKYALENLI